MTQTLISELKPFIQEVWKKSNFSQPTTIQSNAIPAAVEGKDLIAESPTGTGKTLAYLLPILEKIESDQKSLQAVIIAPSQELVMQILQEIQKWSEGSGIRAASFIGGANVKRQLEKLKKHPHIALGTPGRMLELIKQKKLKMHEVKMIVLDEGDQLLVPEHLETVRNIVKSALSERQILLFSATLPQGTEKLARELTADPEIIRVEKDETINAANVDHFYFITEKRDKIMMLEKISRLDEIKALVFVKDIGNLTVMSEKLAYKNILTSSLHSDLNKMDRQNALKDLRTGKTNLLLATDVAARGLDIKDVTHVVHFDFPKDLKQYVHRSGRTGRFGASGTVISLVTEREERELRKFTKELGILASKKVMRAGKIIDPDQRK
ncbi:DEAD/DEAH box helicase [Bacillus sp. DTU_2020_1000418_1_SI_GHA_SEK_038]|uniref:DEAD/DEAH box helicase n=1 Tax=Bacillus sp. DTU_2020_1000418_1_SI_GHA_SEK_038 TaxID=3077585 RepID=UPI0028E6A912|nr:DEAD/DEAH box helicase [Bacillus sp. DTU_2020_1000418_1_SI_GHA_SEK_038]WNS76325.1 DEAD/DEAH box helicase [Bacillus sp. DTU_2020_1000418_1_SI_GHA_SEK_038]